MRKEEHKLVLVSATLISLKFALITLYGLALPILWNFYRNGVLTTRTLPKFSFVTILQNTFVVILGLLLVGCPALIGGFRKKNREQGVLPYSCKSVLRLDAGSLFLINAGLLFCTLTTKTKQLFSR